jgi:prephenate dehydrogenase
VFERVTIVGVGLIGGSLAAAFKRCSLAREIVGVSSPSTTEKALALGIIDRACGYDRLEQGVGGADLVVLCTPISRILELIPAVSRAVAPGTIVTDVGSTKRRIMEAAAAHVPSNVAFIGGHPMAGSEKSGVSASDPFLFENAIYVLTPSPGTPADKLERLRDACQAVGARVLVLEPELHDGIAAAVSHLPQMLAVGLVNMLSGFVREQPAYLDLAAGGFRDMTRIASSPFTVWSDICQTNGDLIRERLDRYIAYLERIREQVGTDALGDMFSVANQVRGRIPRDSKGFLHPLAEVLVVVEDRPGMIAGIAAALGDRDININDIEVLKVREGEGGTVRLSLNDRQVAQQAVAVLQEAGFEARIRE